MTSTCPTCSAPLGDDARFCSSCGRSVAPEAAAPEPDTATQSTPLGPPIAPPVSAASAPPDPTDVVVSESGGDHDGPRRGIGRILVVGAVVLGVLALGWIVVRALDDDAAGGSSSPDDLAQDMVDAIVERDALAFLDLVAPDEFDGVDDVIERATDRFGDLDDDVFGVEDSEVSFDVDLELDDVDVSMQGDSAAIVSFDVSGRIELDAAGFFGEESIDERFDSRDLPSDTTLTEMIAVRLDGRWYFSPMLTVGHLIVENADLPRGDYDRIGEDRPGGGDSPEEAVQALVEAVNDLDASGFAGAVGGGEGRVLTVFEDAIDDALRDADTSGVEYELRVETTDVGSGRVELTEIEFELDDGFDAGTVAVEDGCYRARTERESSRGCLDEVELFADVDPTIWLDTVREGGAYRVRVVPTYLDVLDRLLQAGERDELLYAFDSAYLDDAIDVDVGSDVEIAFDGELYVVHEFEVSRDGWYLVESSNADIEPVVYVGDGFGFSQLWSFPGEPFRAFDDGTVKVVTPSELPSGESYCDGVTCLPTRSGETTLRIREAARQVVEFPTILSGELGPSDVVVLELDVAAPESVRIDVEGDVEIDAGDLRSYEFGDRVYDLPSGTFELVVYNPDPEDGTDYRIVPSPVD